MRRSPGRTPPPDEIVCRHSGHRRNESVRVAADRIARPACLKTKGKQAWLAGCTWRATITGLTVMHVHQLLVSLSRSSQDSLSLAKRIAFIARTAATGSRHHPTC